jgi:HEAT repeat protein
MHPQHIIELFDMSYEPSERTRQRLLAEASLSDLLVAREESPSDIVREHLCITLQALPKDALLKAWQIGLSPLVKSWLCSVLKDQPDEQTIQIFIAALNDEDSMLQSSAIEAREEIDSPLVGPALLARFLVQTDGALRGWLAYALGQVGYRPASAALFGALEEKGEEKSNLRCYAANALQRLQAPGAREAIQQALAQATEPDETAELSFSLELAAGKLTREDLTGQHILQYLAEPLENYIPLLFHIERTAAQSEFFRTRW